MFTPGNYAICLEFAVREKDIVTWVHRSALPDKVRQLIPVGILLLSIDLKGVFLHVIPMHVVSLNILNSKR